MSELEDKLNGLLSDPEQMNRLAQMAKSIMGEQNADTQNGAAQSAPGGIDPGIVGRLMSRLSGEKDDKQALLEALKPYLAEKRQVRMDKAMKIAKMARLAEIALKEYGGEGNGL